MAVAGSNAGRECGHRSDGWYLDAPMAPNGTLLPLVWACGSMVLSMDGNLPWRPQERTLVYMDGEQSFDLEGTEWVEYRVGRANRASGAYRGSNKQQLERLRHTADDPLTLLKHMGSSFYTPATKAIELVQKGPSERFPKETVLALAPYLRLAPLKLLYTSNKVPVFVTAADRDAFMDYLFVEEPSNDHLFLQVAWSMNYNEDETLWEPTWHYADWSWRMRRTPEGLKHPNNGSMHWWVKLLSYVHRHKDVQIGGLVEREMVCFGTHLTQAVRVVNYETAQRVTGKDTIVPEELDDAQFFGDDNDIKRATKAGVQVVILPPEGHEEWE